jgi:hypothetical protein
MRYLILSLVLFVGCVNKFSYQDAIYVESVPVMCRVPNLNGMKYSVTLWTIDSMPRQLDVFKLNFLTKEYFTCRVPTHGVDVTIQAYGDSSGNFTHISESVIRNAVAYDWGEEDNKTDLEKRNHCKKVTAEDTLRGEPIVYPYTIDGDIVYTLKPLEPRD